MLIWKRLNRKKFTQLMVVNLTVLDYKVAKYFYLLKTSGERFNDFFQKLWKILVDQDANMKVIFFFDTK